MLHARLSTPCKGLPNVDIRKLLPKIRFSPTDYLRAMSAKPEELMKLTSLYKALRIKNYLTTPHVNY